MISRHPRLRASETPERTRWEELSPPTNGDAAWRQKKCTANHGAPFLSSGLSVQWRLVARGENIARAWLPHYSHRAFAKQRVSRICGGRQSGNGNFLCTVSVVFSCFDMRTLFASHAVCGKSSAPLTAPLS